MFYEKNFIGTCIKNICEKKYIETKMLIKLIMMI